MRFIKQPLIFFLCLSYLEMEFLSLQENGYFPNVSECWHLSFKRYTYIALRGSGVMWHEILVWLCAGMFLYHTMLTSYTFTFIEWNKDFLYIKSLPCSLKHRYMRLPRILSKKYNTNKSMSFSSDNDSYYHLISV